MGSKFRQALRDDVEDCNVLEEPAEKASFLSVSRFQSIASSSIHARIGSVPARDGPSDPETASPSPAKPKGRLRGKGISAKVQQRDQPSAHFNSLTGNDTAAAGIWPVSRIRVEEAATSPSTSIVTTFKDDLVKSPDLPATIPPTKQGSIESNRDTESTLPSSTRVATPTESTMVQCLDLPSPSILDLTGAVSFSQAPPSFNGTYSTVIQGFYGDKKVRLYYSSIIFIFIFDADGCRLPSKLYA